MEQDPHIDKQTVTLNIFLCFAINLAQPPKPFLLTSLEDVSC